MNLIHAINVNGAQARLWIYTRDDTGEITLISGKTRTIISLFARSSGAEYSESTSLKFKKMHINTLNTKNLSILSTCFECCHPACLNFKDKDYSVTGIFGST